MSVRRVCAVVLLIGFAFSVWNEVKAQSDDNIAKELAGKRLGEGNLGDAAAVKNPWSFKGNVSVTMTQVMLHNWVPGGENSLSATGLSEGSSCLDYNVGSGVWSAKTGGRSSR